MKECRKYSVLFQLKRPMLLNDAEMSTRQQSGRQCVEYELDVCSRPCMDRVDGRTVYTSSQQTSLAVYPGSSLITASKLDRRRAHIKYRAACGRQNPNHELAGKCILKYELKQWYYRQSGRKGTRTRKYPTPGILVVGACLPHKSIIYNESHTWKQIHT